ncbi:MAG: YdeI/OmpD-associated family protein [Phaeodactylibacter sp.]|nr:YdeI/OmpD-associated family protein [Phaeodactylibacter sp.]
MEITEVFYPKVRSEWRDWLDTHHQSKAEVWLRRFKKASGKPCINYDELVEECLCFGWIDGVIKRLDEESNVQRITPRRKKKTFLSELNRQRVWKLQRLGLITPAGIEPIADQIGSPDDPFEIPDWVEAQLREDPEVWANFQDFSHFYRRLKIGWIKECGPRRQEEAQKRLNYLIKMTRQGKQYGTIPLED